MGQPEYYTKIVKEFHEEKTIDNKNIVVGFVIIEKRIELPKGKSTTKGEYPKLAPDNKCSYPERADCNYGNFFERCKYMKYNNTSGTFGRGNWICEYPLNNK